MGVNRAGDGDGWADLLPVPGAEVASLAAMVNSMIEQLDAVVVTRSSGREITLVDWVASNRVLWDEDFSFAQLDLSSCIDDLQAFKGSIEAVVQEIEEHNQSVLARMLGDGGGSL